ncbi:MAG: hypothetical protein V2B19_11105 [Pseudomonadota bacterium]
MTIFLQPSEKRKTSFTGNVSSLFLGIWFLLIVSGPVAHAYYDIPEHPPTNFAQEERQNASPGVRGTFVLYEHVDPAVSGMLKPPPLTYFSDRFIPADKIPANQPIHMVPRRPIDPANEVANSLYANLKLKLLLEEYAELQTRARKMLAGLEHPATGLEKGSGPEEHPVNLHQLRENLRLKQLMISRALPVMASAVNSPGDVAIAAGGGAPAATVMDSYRVADSAGMPPGETAGLSSGSAAGRGIGTRNTEASLPWIIEAAFTLLAYLQANKAEAIIYGVLLMTILMGVSTLRRR